MYMNENESLKKSHSKSSNAKLTLLCFITILAFSILWIGIALLLKEDIPTAISLPITIGSGLVTILGLICFSKFKR